MGCAKHGMLANIKWLWLFGAMISSQVYALSSERIAASHVLKSPLSSWVKILPLNGEHVIQATPEYRWSYNNQFNNVYLDAKGRINPLDEQEQPRSAGLLGSAHVEKLHTYQITNFNKLLAKSLGEPVAYKEVHTLRVFSEFGFAYDLSFFSNNKQLSYVMVCINHCANVQPKVLQVFPV
ncbi:hypothetical protein [Pseudoalteromonas sp. T1lg23B]|uniref:hypothetical protein n=3 Tax=Pseudoalteromonas sp. T1lg23B TaxID=2077097 RepID=UPI000CF660C4|nr:hypothetical protein [Pseudoalteromonas sp. T1lg23B]